MAFKSLFLLCSLSLSFIICSVIPAVESIPINPVPLLRSFKSSTFFWYPTENGGVVPAFLEGGPKTKANENEIKFYLYTLQNQNSAEELIIGDDAKLDASHYVKGAPLKILTHGFSSSSTGGPGPGFKTQYFRAGSNYNVVLLDWAPLAAAPWYDVAAGNTKLVGEKTGRLILYLVSRGYVTLDQVHFAGHSLGAHAAGFAGNLVGAGKLGRITALDPALPLFGAADDSGRIDPSDAAFVDVIHSAGGTLLDGGLSFREPRGHVDFYPNSGENQPGCGIDAFGACSHSRCYAYMDESINNRAGFRACKCNSWDEFNLGNCACVETADMGEHVSRSARGNYYLKTNSQSPYAQG